MDLIAALALVLVIEGLAVAIFASSLPELVATLREIEPDRRRMLGIVMAAVGGITYLIVRG